MATIALYANKINNMPSLIKDVKKSVTDFKSELSNLKNKSLKVNKSTCDLDDVISTISTSTQTQERKVTALESFGKNVEQFASDVAKIDSNVADVINKNKDDFYKDYSHLKPSSEKNLWDKFKGGCKKVGEWCKEHWKAIAAVIAVIIVAIVVAILTGGAGLIVLVLLGVLSLLTGCSNPDVTAEPPATEPPVTTQPPMTTEPPVKEEPSAIVSRDQLIACGWDDSVLTDEMVAELNRTLQKYEINTPERISHFMAQCLRESARGTGIHEWGDEAYFDDKAYGSKYRGVGYIHMTWDYSYQAFATFLALREYPGLSDYATFRSPDNNDKQTIDNEYAKLLNGAKELGVDISKYTDIYDIGYTYVEKNYSWESAGYDWTVKKLNDLVDSGASVDDVSSKVNKWDTDVAFNEKRDYYNDIIEKGIFK